MNIRIQSKVPKEAIARLAKRKGAYTDMVSVFHCVMLDLEHWIGVAGDGDNGSYEYWILKHGQLSTSDCGYGDSAIALRDVLQKEAT